MTDLALDFDKNTRTYWAITKKETSEIRRINVLGCPGVNFVPITQYDRHNLSTDYFWLSARKRLDKKPVRHQAFY